MTKSEAEKLGWEFEGSDNDVTAENGRLIFMGSLKVVLAMIQSLANKVGSN